jgi:hypothetical protein
MDWLAFAQDDGAFAAPREVSAGIIRKMKSGFCVKIRCVILSRNLRGSTGFLGDRHESNQKMLDPSCRFGLFVWSNRLAGG